MNQCRTNSGGAALQAQGLPQKVIQPSQSVLLLAPSVGLGGGIERYVSSIADGLNQLGVEVRRLNLYTGQRGGGLAKATFIMRTIVGAIRRRPSTIFVMHPNLFPVGSLASSLTRRPWFGWTYGAEVFEATDAQRVVAHAKSARRLVTISQYTAAALESGGARPADLDLVRPVLERQWWSYLDRPQPEKSPVPQLIAVSRLGTEARAKGIDSLLDLAVGLRDEGRAFRLVIVGDGDGRDGYRRRIERDGLSEHVVLTGRLADTELVDTLRASWLFVLPSRVDASLGGGEGFGIVYVEAASVGIPVVGSSDGGASEAVCDGVNGYAVDPSDLSAVATRVRELLDDEDLRDRMGQAGQLWAKVEFGPGRMADAMGRLLQLA